MAMGNLAIIVVGIISAALVLFLYNMLVVKTKKVTGEWVAEIYTRSNSKKTVGQLSMSDLRFYGFDKLRKTELKNSVLYMLVSLGKTTPAVTNDVEELIGNDGKTPKKRVKVLLEGDSCTLLQQGYVENTVVFNPISYDKNNQIQNDIIVHEARHSKKESFWNQIAPFLNIMVICLMIIICTMLIGNTQAKISQENTDQLAIQSQMQETVSENIAISNLIANGFTTTDLNILKNEIDEIKKLSNGENTLGKQNNYINKSNIPSIE